VACLAPQGADAPPVVRHQTTSSFPRARRSCSRSWPSAPRATACLVTRAPARAPRG